MLYYDNKCYIMTTAVFPFTASEIVEAQYQHTLLATSSWTKVEVGTTENKKGLLKLAEAWARVAPAWATDKDGQLARANKEISRLEVGEYNQKNGEAEWCSVKPAN